MPPGQAPSLGLYSGARAGADRLYELVAEQAARELAAAKYAEELRAKQFEEMVKFGQLGVNMNEANTKSAAELRQANEWLWKLRNPEQVTERDVLDAQGRPSVLSMNKYGGGNRTTLGQLYKAPETPHTVTLSGQAGPKADTKYTRIVDQRDPSRVLYESAEVEDDAGGAADDAIAAYGEERAARALANVQTLRTKVSPLNTGLGSLLANIPGTSARDFQAQVDTLKANISFNELAQMREASKTGGALGSISNRELDLLSSALGALDTGQGKQNFLRQLDAIESSLQRWHAARAQAPTAKPGAAAVPAAPAPPAARASRPPRRVTMDELRAAPPSSKPATVPLLPTPRTPASLRRVVTMDELNPRRVVQMPDLSGAETISRRSFVVPR